MESRFTIPQLNAMVDQAVKSVAEAEKTFMGAVAALKIFANESTDVDDPLHIARVNVRGIVSSPNIEAAHRTLANVAAQLKTVFPQLPPEKPIAPPSEYPKVLSNPAKKGALDEKLTVTTPAEETAARANGFTVLAP